MKGEYRDDKDTMFSKYHHHHNQTPPPFAITNRPFNLSNNTSEEADSRNNNNNNRDRSRSPPSNLTNKQIISLHNDGETIEVARRPRGRPPGSKNKPKPPIIITREPDPSLSMSPYVLELPAGVDIVETVNNYCRTRKMGLCILSGSGSVTNVTLRQPTSTPPASVTFHGRFDVLSLSATVSPSAPYANGFTISLAGPQGQIVGGAVSGQLMSGGTVFIIAASFNNPLYHRLGGGDDDHDHDVIEGGGVANVGHSGGGVANVGHSGGGGGGSHEQSPAAGSGGGGVDHVPHSNESMYNVHDVMWAPPARQASSQLPPY